MTVEELQNLVREIQAHRCEKQNIEIKEAHEGTPKRLYDTLSAFANQVHGGIIIFGISERNNYSVIGVYNAQDLQVKVTEQGQQMSPVIKPFFTVAEIEDKLVVSAAIAEADVFDKPCFYMGAGRLRGSYQRVGDADIQMTEYEVYSYEAFKRKIQDELRMVERADMGALDNGLITEYFSKLRSEKPNKLNFTDRQLMQFQGLAENGKPTIAGLMLFGLYPQGFFPQLSITAMVVPGYEVANTGTTERFIDNKRIEGTIPQMFEGAFNFIRRNMRTKTIIDDKTAKRQDKTEYPLLAIREILLNCLINRDYSVHTDNSPIRIVMYKNRIVFENPGGLYGRLTIDELGTRAADTRNPFIAGALEVMLKTENRFSGVPTIITEMISDKLPPPVFESSRGVFKVTLYNGEENGAIQEAKNSKTFFEERIKEFCKTPRSRDELAKEFNLGSTYYVITRYIRPLIAREILQMTLLDAPKSKNQRYVSR